MATGTAEGTGTTAAALIVISVLGRDCNGVVLVKLDAAWREPRLSPFSFLDRGVFVLGTAAVIAVLADWGWRLCTAESVGSCCSAVSAFSAGTLPLVKGKAEDPAGACVNCSGGGSELSGAAIGAKLVALKGIWRLLEFCIGSGDCWAGICSIDNGRGAGGW